MDNIKSLLELYDDEEKDVFKSILISFFPIYLTGYLFFPTFQVLDIWKSLFLIAGVDVMLNFTLLFIVTLNPQLHSRSATYIKRNELLIRKTAIKSSHPFQYAYHSLTP